MKRVGPENVIQGDGAFGGGEKPSAAAAQILRRHCVGKAVFESPTTRIDRGRLLKERRLVRFPQAARTYR